MTAVLTPHRRAIVLLMLLTLVWGTNWPLFPMAVREMSVWTFRAVSVPFSGLVLLAVARLRGESLVVPRAALGVLLAVTVCYLMVWNIATAYAAVLIPSGQAAVLAFTMPLWAALIMFSALSTKQHVVLDIAGGLALALASHMVVRRMKVVSHDHA